MSERASGLPIRASHVVFDVDGTLLDFVGAVRAGWIAAAGRIAALTSRTVSAQDISEVRERVRAEPEWRGRSASELRDEALRRLLSAGGLAGGALRNALAEVNELLLASRDASITVYEDVRPALESLRERGFVLAAASNGNMDLSAAGLGGYFSLFQGSDQAGVMKPDPRVFSTVVASLGTTPEQAVAVGDRWDNDVEPALKAGLHAVLLDRRGDADLEAAERASVPHVRSLAGLADMLEFAPA